MGCTLKDIAKEAGVSAATVSLVLNNKTGISDETRKAVYQAAMKLNYSYHPTQNKTKTNRPICFIKIASHGKVVNENHKGFIADYIDGIEKEAREAGYPLEVRSYSEFDIEKILGDIYRQNFSGVIILATELQEADIMKFKDLAITKIFLDASYPFHSFDFVNMDNESALYTVIKRFKEHGINKIGLAKSSIMTRNFELREQYFYEALKYFGCEINKNWELTVSPTLSGAYEDSLKAIKNMGEKPEGYFCVCDTIAIGVMKAFKENRIHIPQDISLIGFDDLPQCLTTDPPLSSVKVSKKLMGKRAFQYLEKMMNSERRVASEKTFIGCEVICRDSLLNK